MGLTCYIRQYLCEFRNFKMSSHITADCYYGTQKLLMLNIILLSYTEGLYRTTSVILMISKTLIFT